MFSQGASTLCKILLFLLGKTKPSRGHWLKKGRWCKVMHVQESKPVSKLCLNLPTDTFLCETEKGKASLAYRGLKISDGHSTFKPLKQDSAKHVVVSIATGVKSKVRIFLSLCVSCLLHSIPGKPVRSSLKPCMYNTDPVHQMTFKGLSSMLCLDTVRALYHSTS